MFQSGQRAATADGRWADCLAEQSTREKRRNKELTHHGAKVGGRPRAQKPATGVNANPVAFVERSRIIDGEAVACDDNGVACLPSGTARIEPVVLPSTVARVEGLVGRRDLPGATNAVEAVKPKGLHQVNRPIA